MDRSRARWLPAPVFVLAISLLVIGIPLAEFGRPTFRNPRTYVSSCAERGLLAALAASKPLIDLNSVSGGRLNV